MGAICFSVFVSLAMMFCGDINTMATTCNNTCQGILSTLQARDVFCWDAIQDGVCIVQPRGDKGSSDSTDR